MKPKSGLRKEGTRWEKGRKGFRLLENRLVRLTTGSGADWNVKLTLTNPRGNVKLEPRIRAEEKV